MNPSIKRSHLFLFWGGMAFSVIGAFLLVKPSIASPLIWFLVAIALLIGAAFLLQHRYRVAALVVASLCFTARNTRRAAIGTERNPRGRRNP
jgi:hypothetical protein